MSQRLTNVLNSNPSAAEIATNFSIAYKFDSPNQQKIAAEVYTYPPHVAAQVVLNLKNDSLEPGVANAFVNCLMDCFVEERG